MSKMVFFVCFVFEMMKITFIHTYLFVFFFSSSLYKKKRTKSISYIHLFVGKRETIRSVYILKHLFHYRICSHSFFLYMLCYLLNNLRCICHLALWFFFFSFSFVVVVGFLFLYFKWLYLSVQYLYLIHISSKQ